MTPNQPEAAGWLDIPEDCRISGELTGDLPIEFGDIKDGIEMMFERPALERFAAIVTELLAPPIPVDPRKDLPRLHTPG